MKGLRILAALALLCGCATQRAWVYAPTLPPVPGGPRPERLWPAPLVRRRPGGYRLESARRRSRLRGPAHGADALLSALRRHAIPEDELALRDGERLQLPSDARGGLPAVRRRPCTGSAATQGRRLALIPGHALPTS